MKYRFDSSWTPAVMVTVFFVALFVIACNAFGATKADLRDKLIASGDYIEVGQPIVLRPVQGQGGMSATRYYIAVLETGADSLVAYQRAIYLWSVNDGDSTETAYFLDRDPTITVPVVTNFYGIVKAKMENLGIEGMITETGSVGNKEWALVDRYIEGTTASDFKTVKYKITRTDGATWSVAVLEL